MAHIRESKLDNGMIGLEITYGGREEPFGGVDTSAPPMYIDRNCFTAANNMLVLNEQLVACGWLSEDITLSSWNTFDQFLGSGSWYINGIYKNFVLAARTTIPVGLHVESIVFDIWVWESGTTGAIDKTATLEITQGPEFSDATPSTAQITISSSYSVPVDTTITVTVDADSVSVTYHPTDTSKILAQAIVTAINAAVGYPATAVLNSDGYTITLTSVDTGTGANAHMLSIGYNPTTNPQNGVNVPAQFQGGSDPVSLPSGSYGVPLSWTAVGETLYFAGRGGTVMLSYTENSNVPVFSILTQYLCANTLGKFNGQLIAAGITLGPGLRLSTPEMIIAWSAPNQLGVWNPLNADGTVTGAGFNQETDISDSISGIFIGNGSAIIFRAQGIDYITPLSGGVIPFDFVHISNTLQGEGCQDSRLLTAYDQAGAFIGNTDIFMFSGGISPIAQKVRNTILGALKSTIKNRDSQTCVFGLSSGYSTILYAFLIDYVLYIYNPTNKTWMFFSIPPRNAPFLNQYYLANWKAFGAVNGQNQFNTPGRLVLVVIDADTGPTFYRLTSANQNTDFPHDTSSSISFPQEEIAFGRDVTIDGLIISCAGLPGQVINFNILGLNSFRDGGGDATPISGTLTLPATATTTEFQNYQVTFSAAQTVQNPQLTLQINNDGTGVQNPINIAKIAMFGSYDPNQRPV